MTRTDALIAMALVGCLAGASLSFAQAGGANVPASSAAPQLTEIQKLRAENLQLKVAVTQLRLALAQREAETAAAQLDQQRLALEQEFRRTLKAGPSDTFDWQKLIFVPSPEPPKP